HAMIAWPNNLRVLEKKLLLPLNKEVLIPKTILAFDVLFRMQRLLICRKIAFRLPSKGLLIRIPLIMKKLCTKAMHPMEWLSWWKLQPITIRALWPMYVCILIKEMEIWAVVEV